MKKRYIKINHLHKLCAEMGLLGIENKCVIAVHRTEYTLCWIDDVSQKWQLTIAKEIFFDPFDKTDGCLIKLTRYEYDPTTGSTGGTLSTRDWFMPIGLMKTPEVIAVVVNKMTTDTTIVPLFNFRPYGAVHLTFLPV